jgi:hypothetical protein
MRSLLLALCAASLAVLAPAAGAKPAAPASVSLEDCRSADPELAIFYGSMKAVPGTTRMSMRFELLERMGGGRFVKVDAPGLGVWHRSRAGARRFGYRQKLDNLDRTASYRTVVRYRWFDAGGERLLSATRASAVCGPPSELPNLRIGKVESRAGSAPGSVVYSINVRNDGGSTARAVSVLLRMDGQALQERQLAVLGSGELQTIGWTAGRCGDRLDAVVDPANTVRESIETDNLRVVGCPVPGS